MHNPLLTKFPVQLAPQQQNSTKHSSKSFLLCLDFPSTGMLPILPAQMPEQSIPQLISQESVEGALKAWGRCEGRQFRDGTLRLVTCSAGMVVIRTARASIQPPLFAANSLCFPLTGPAELHYVTPAGVGIAVSRCDSVSYHSRPGVVEWSFWHDPWGDNGGGACGETSDGRYLLTIVPGTLDDTGGYPGDRCVVLESETGKGGDDSYSWKVDIVDGCLHLVELASGLERVTGAQHNRVLVEDGLLKLQVRDVAPDGTVHVESEMNFRSEADSEDMSAEEDEEELFLTGASGFVDDSYVIAAVGEDWCPEKSDHFLLDAESLAILSQIQYPFPVGPWPIALHDGTWVTVAGESVCRWRIAQ
ncbi:hypothetical protein N7452_010682 [Penicillium brevicompactum]|uniref:Uncharacterized protein n=1 Tax=Penicillium brevicompactum TaxID=5074 RepID=A0A9W9Q0P7_PENBR|nr:hypothetical protein N7452_010682 [Penicillium brevicompactum]